MWKLVKYKGKYCAYCTKDGQTVRRSSGTNDRLKARQWFDDFIKSQTIPSETVNEAYLAYMDQVTPNEAQKMKIMAKPLMPFFGDYRVDQLDREKAKEYAKFRSAQGISNNTIIRELGSIRAAARWYNKNYPSTWFMPPKPEPKDRYLTRKEYDKLLECTSAAHIRLFVILGLATGARTSAILDLTWDRVDFSKGIIRLGNGAHNKRRATVPINDKALHALKEAYEYRSCEFVIEYASKQVKSIRTGFDRARDKAGLGPDVTPHVLRHTAAVWMAEAGIPMDEIAQFLGHTTPMITYRVYARYSPGYLRKASDILQ